MSGYLDASQRIGHRLRIKIDGPLYLTQKDIEDLHILLDPYGEDRARVFARDIDIRLWDQGQSEERSSRPRALLEKPLPKRSLERRQLEALERAALAIAEVLNDPAGDLRQRLGGWFDLAHLEQQTLHLLHFANHTLAATAREHGKNTTIPEATVSECRILIHRFRHHYPDLSVTPNESVFHNVTKIVFGQEYPKQLITRALLPHQAGAR